MMRNQTLWVAGVAIVCLGCRDDSSSKRPAQQGSSSPTVATTAPPDSSTATVAPTSTLDEACARVANATCLIEEHVQREDFVVSYGTTAHCQERHMRTCLAEARLPNSGWTAASVDACARAHANLSDFWQFIQVRALCSPPGTAPDGAACESDSQCASGDCSESTPRCGVCQKKRLRALAESEACGETDTMCGLGLVCAKNKVCTKRAPIALGQPCDDSQPCASLGQCVVGRCVADAKLGEECSHGGSQVTKPACAPALTCDVATQKCIAVAFGAVGEVCRNTTILQRSGNTETSSSEGRCAGGWCNEKGAKSRCEPFLADGAACTDKTAWQCEPPAKCIRGKCALAAGACPAS